MGSVPDLGTVLLFSSRRLFPYEIVDDGVSGVAERPLSTSGVGMKPMMRVHEHGEKVETRARSSSLG